MKELRFRKLRENWNTAEECQPKKKRDYHETFISLRESLSKILPMKAGLTIAYLTPLTTQKKKKEKKEKK